MSTTQELDTDIVKQSLLTEDGQELDIRTPYIVRTVNVPTQMRVPLYVSGTLKSAAELAELGLTLKQYTRLEVETAQYAAYYSANPALAVRVRQYKAILDACGLESNASSDQISTAIQSDTSMSDAEKTTAAASLLTLIHDIEINWNELNPGEGLTAWAALPKLIKYLPPEESAGE